jgi:hypothetical protein
LAFGHDAGGLSRLRPRGLFRVETPVLRDQEISRHHEVRRPQQGPNRATSRGPAQRCPSA